MKTTELRLDIPAEILYTLNETKNDFIKKMKFYTALELCRLQKISAGKAAELAGMQKIDFIFELGKHDVPVINYEIDDFLEEVEAMTK
jgi:predicted HTH domain antitoxin